MNIFVTGGTGFIGRHLLQSLRTRFPRDEIYCLVETGDSGATPSLATPHDRSVSDIDGDLLRPEVSAAAPPAVDLVFHLAANIDTDAAEAELRVNDVGTGHLLSWLAPSLRGARVIYASTIAVVDRDHPADGPLNETSPCVPRTAYGRTKLRGETIIRQRAVALGYDYTILRLATVYGVGAKTGGLFDRLFQLTKTHSVLSRLNWPGRTSIIHVGDVVAIMIGLAMRKEAAGETYGVANPDAPTVGALAAHIAQFAPAPVSAIRLPDWVWRFGRTLAWSAPFQFVASAVADTAAWRLTLILGDGFWLDTNKLQQIWTSPLKDVVEGLAEMLKYQ